MVGKRIARGLASGTKYGQLLGRSHKRLEIINIQHDIVIIYPVDEDLNISVSNPNAE
jgi:hypothetical protein